MSEQRKPTWGDAPSKPQRRHCGCVCPKEGQGVCVLPWGHNGGHRTAWRRVVDMSFGRPWARLYRYGWGVPVTWQESDLVMQFMHLRHDEARV